MSDLIDVRPDERFDVERLASWTDSRPGLPGGSPTVQQFGGGKANLTYLLTFPDGQELVLRRPPLGPVAESSHDMAREYRVLSRLWRSFDKAPRAIAFCDNTDVIGSQFFLMEPRGGLVIRSEVPEAFGGGSDEQANQQLSATVIDTLAEFHAVDPDECGLGDIGHPDGFLDRQITGWIQRWNNAQDRENQVADSVGAWLADNVPRSGPPTLLHNDWRLDNMAVSETDPSLATAVFDWDMATRGDPLVDLGTLLGSWFDPGEAPPGFGMMPTTVPGWLDRQAAIARYADVSGRSLDEFSWHLVFGSWKLAVILQQIYIRWLRGQTEDERFSSMGKGAAFLFEHAAERLRLLAE